MPAELLAGAGVVQVDRGQRVRVGVQTRLTEHIAQERAEQWRIVECAQRRVSRYLVVRYAALGRYHRDVAHMVVVERRIGRRQINVVLLRAVICQVLTLFALTPDGVDRCGKQEPRHDERAIPLQRVATLGA